jgi:ring-1,2-phenylacetyl-CoA epoxidase subunit PaaD
MVNAMFTKEDILTFLDNVCDPEVPVLTIRDLGIVREIHILENQSVEVVITPTYSGCPAMNAISMAIKFELIAQGLKEVKVTEVLSPAWTTDWMSEAGKEKLRAYGIAPPQYTTANNPEEAVVPCPQCHSTHTELLSQFGSTSCKALYRCLDCKEPFDYFKCH